MYNSAVCDTAKVRFFKQITTAGLISAGGKCCLWYCKSTIFQANHNCRFCFHSPCDAVCDTAKVRFFKQITTACGRTMHDKSCLWYCKSTIFQANHNHSLACAGGTGAVCDTAKVRFFKQITTYDTEISAYCCCLWYCKSTIFQANHNNIWRYSWLVRLFVILQKYDFSSKSQRGKARATIWTAVCDTAKVRFFKQITTETFVYCASWWLFVILQKYDFSSKSQLSGVGLNKKKGCLWYCKSTIFQANHNEFRAISNPTRAVCDTAKVRFFKQITTASLNTLLISCCLWYCKSTIFQANHNIFQTQECRNTAVCDTAKVRFFKQITTQQAMQMFNPELFVILQKYDFSSKSQLPSYSFWQESGCLWYCKSTIFQANHNYVKHFLPYIQLFVILQKYDFSSKSQLSGVGLNKKKGCLWYCKSTIFQANHNEFRAISNPTRAVCDTAKVRFFKQITTASLNTLLISCCLWYCKSTIFQANHNIFQTQECRNTAVCDTAKVRFFKQITTRDLLVAFLSRCLWYCKSTIFQANHNISLSLVKLIFAVCDTAKVRFFKQITTIVIMFCVSVMLFVILQKYDFSSKSQPAPVGALLPVSCLWYCKSTIFQANHNNAEHIGCWRMAVCDTAKVRFFKQITTFHSYCRPIRSCLWYCKSTIFQANHNASTFVL